MNFRMPVALAATLLLASCGGGSPPGPPPPPPPPASDPSIFDTFVAGDVLLGAQDRLYRAGSFCTGSTCTVIYQGESVMVNLLDIDPSASTTAITGQQLRNGVQTGRLASSDGETRFDALGVWGEYNAATTGAGSTTLDGLAIRFVVPASVGYASAANPVSGGVLWSGAMTGMKFGDSGLEAEVAGDAAMAVDLVGATLDLAFTNIAELSSGTAVGNIGWQDVPMLGGGFRDDGLDGRFYGPDHEEAGGVFERDGVAGAFSLKRD